MYLFTSTFTNPTEKYLTKIAELREKNILNYVETFKALLHCYLDTNAAFFSSNHYEYCKRLIDKINKESLTISQILQNVNEYIASRKQANQYEMTSDFQIMLDTFLKEYETPVIIPCKPLQQKYVKIIQNYKRHNASEVITALEYLAEIELETDFKYHMIKQLILPILLDQGQRDVRTEIFEHILLKFLPLSKDLLQVLMPIYKKTIRESGIVAHFKFINIPLLFPEDFEFQKIMVDFCNTFPPHLDVARMILQLLPNISDKKLKENAIQCLINSLGGDGSHDKHITVNTLVDLLSGSDDDIKNYIVVKLEEIFYISDDDQVRNKLLRNPSFPKLGCAYFHAKGKSENDINKILIGPQPLLMYPCTLTDCVIGILTGYKNFTNPVTGAKDVFCMLESRLRYNNKFFGAREQIFQLIEQYPEIYKYSKKEIVETLKRNVIADDEKNLSFRSLKTLIIIAKNDSTFQSNIHQFLLDMPESLLQEIVRSKSAAQLKAILPAEILMTNERTFNLVFDCLLPLLDVNQKKVLHYNINNTLVYYTKSLTTVQLEALRRKIQTLYKDPGERSDYCQILLSNIERRLLIQLARSREKNEYMSLLPIELRDVRLIPHF